MSTSDATGLPPVTHMMFGRYNGRPIVELPDVYLAWRLRQKTVKTRLRAALEAERQRRRLTSA
jgi:uncharacterized protein (DUF3820 family)